MNICCIQKLYFQNHTTESVPKLILLIHLMFRLLHLIGYLSIKSYIHFCSIPYIQSKKQYITLSNYQKYYKSEERQTHKILIMDDHQSNDANSGTTSNGSFRWNRYYKLKRNVVYLFIKPLNCIVNIGIPPIILSFYNLFKLCILPSCLAFNVYLKNFFVSISYQILFVHKRMLHLFIIQFHIR